MKQASKTELINCLKVLRKKPKALRTERDRQKINEVKNRLKKLSRNGKSKKVKPKKKRLTKYQKYLLSDEWAKLKIDLYAHRGRWCQKCGSSTRLQIHHLHYRNIYKEEPEDLLILCRACHRAEHSDKAKKKRTAKRMGVCPRVK